MCQGAVSGIIQPTCQVSLSFYHLQSILSAEPQDTDANASFSPERCLRLQIPPPQLLRRQISKFSIVAKETQAR